MNNEDDSKRDKGQQVLPTALTIAGSDASGGAGIQADLKTFSALGVFGMSAIVSVVAENTSRVIAIEDVSPQMIKQQIQSVFEDIPPGAVKIGMLSSKECMEAVVEELSSWKPLHVVLDPVMYAKGGAALMQEDAMDTLINSVLPLAEVITPNIPEAEKLAGIEINTVEDMKEAAKRIGEDGPAFVLVKGGHAKAELATDILYEKTSGTFHTLSAEWVNTKNTHGTGCTYSSAIAAYLAKGMDVRQAVSHAKEYVTGAIKASLDLGSGHGPTHHFHPFY